MFAKDGPIAAAMDRYRVRPSQVEMAKAVEQCISREGVLLAEAGTGTGVFQGHRVFGSRAQSFHQCGVS
jgi:hypothetical protein